MASRADEHGRGTMGMRSGVVGTAGVRDDVRSGMAMRAAVG